MFSVLKTNQLYYLTYALLLIWGVALSFNINQFEPLFYLDAHRDSILDYYFRWVTELGDVYPYFFFAGVFWLQKKHKLAYKILVVGILTLLISYFLKGYYLHPRPANILSEHNLLGAFHWLPNYPILKGDFSFPSGHATSAFALWTVVAFTQPGRIIFGMSCLFIAGSVAVSRMYLGAHFPQDILAGSFVGLWIATVVEGLFGISPLEAQKMG